jgi:hypothetical protein
MLIHKLSTLLVLLVCCPLVGCGGGSGPIGKAMKKNLKPVEESTNNTIFRKATPKSPIITPNHMDNDPFKMLKTPPVPIEPPNAPPTNPDTGGQGIDEKNKKAAAGAIGAGAAGMGAGAAIGSNQSQQDSKTEKSAPSFSSSRFKNR